MEKILTEQEKKRVAELLLAYSTIKLTPLQRKFFICSVMQTDIPENEKEGFETITNKKHYLIHNLKMFGKSDKISKAKKEEMKKLSSLRLTAKLSEGVKIVFNLYEKIEFSANTIIYQLHSSLIPYFKYIKKMYEDYNLEYFLFSKCKNAPMLYLLFQKHNINNILYSSIKHIKKCLYLPFDTYKKDYDFYNMFIVPAINDINKYSYYQIDYKYERGGFIEFYPRLKSKKELLYIPDVNDNKAFENNHYVTIEYSL